jgi:hypothetical protein
MTGARLSLRPDAATRPATCASGQPLTHAQDRTLNEHVAQHSGDGGEDERDADVADGMQPVDFRMELPEDRHVIEEEAVRDDAEPQENPGREEPGHETPGGVTENCGEE